MSIPPWPHWWEQQYPDLWTWQRLLLDNAGRFLAALGALGIALAAGWIG